MHTLKSASAVALACSLAACSDRPPVAPAATAADVPESTMLSSLSGGSPPDHEVQCDGARWALFVEGEASRVQRTSNAGPLVLPKPDGMEDYVPVGMGCANSAAVGERLVVAYGEAWPGCNICEWFFVYDHDGRPLNHSVPPMLGDLDSLRPNNDGYIEVTNQLRLQRPDIHYPPRARTTDPDSPSQRDANASVR
jgi:hypothetical protein